MEIKRKVAIVGTSRPLSSVEEHNIVWEICRILRTFDTSTMILSGGADGVDSIAAVEAMKLNLQTKIYNPKKQTWEFFQKRNLEIAKDCDELYCISTSVKSEPCYHHNPPQPHEKTAGCWTMKKALEMGKICKFIKVL